MNVVVRIGQFNPRHHFTVKPILSTENGKVSYRTRDAGLRSCEGCKNLRKFLSNFQASLFALSTSSLMQALRMQSANYATQVVVTTPYSSPSLVDGTCFGVGFCLICVFIGCKFVSSVDVLLFCFADTSTGEYKNHKVLPWLSKERTSEV